ncbi:MAG: 3-hydroxyacyl-CoA dehydrogenase family protein [Desulfotomaculaceae bacterium]|nr:3-hydroxyacyl-CoA dehydrogenase family protein [Desulfotomaculaceae bacterium]
MEIKKIGVLGAGAMGTGIANVAAQGGFDVIISDVDLGIVQKSVGNINSFLNKSVEKGKLTTEQKDEIIARVEPQSGLDGFGDVDLVIEAIFEDMQVKKDNFVKLDKICKPEAILCSNTSSFSITELAATTERPERFAGMHFFNPAPIMRLVEIIRGYYTSDDTVSTLKDVTVKMRKTPVLVKRDSPGFIVNRIMLIQFIEAIKLLEEGVATPEDIDIAVKLGLNYPMGPFELLDFGGVDITYHVVNYLCDEFKDIRWNPPLALKELIRAGRLGRKNGKGFYNY